MTTLHNQASEYERTAEALLKILEKHEDKIFMHNLTGDLRGFIRTRELDKNTQRVLGTLISAGKPSSKPRIY